MNKKLAMKVLAFSLVAVMVVSGFTAMVTAETLSNHQKADKNKNTTTDAILVGNENYQETQGDGWWMKPIDEIGVYIEQIDDWSFSVYLYQRNLDRAKICAGPSIDFDSLTLHIHVGIGFGENWDELMLHPLNIELQETAKGEFKVENATLREKPPESKWDEVHLYRVIAEVDNPSCQLIEKHINGHLSAVAVSKEKLASVNVSTHYSEFYKVNVTGSLQPNHGNKINLSNVTVYYEGEKDFKVGDNVSGYVKLVIPTEGTQFIDAFSQGYYLSKEIPPIADFEAINISFSPNNPWEGEIVKVSSFINYTGPPTLCLVPVEFYALPKDGDLIIEEKIGENYTVAFPGTSEVSINWDTTGFEGNYTIEARVDPDDYFPETDETNNIAIGNITILPSKGPRIEIISPENKTYYNSTIPLSYTVTGWNINSTWYSIDGGENRTPDSIAYAPGIPPVWLCNDTLSNLSVGYHNVTIFADDIGGNVSSRSIGFEIAFPPVTPIVSLPLEPSPPQPGYVWEVSNATTGFIYAGSTYTIVSGAYLPKEVEINKEYKAYFYFTRISNYSNLTYPVYGGDLLWFCIGPGLDINITNLVDWDLYLHLGEGILFPDIWMQHIPLIIHEKPNVNVQFSYNKSRNLTIDEFEYGKWSDPVIINFTATTIPPSEAIFDTGRPQNPYPSIPGTHNGTITPNQTITVNKLYTYPCPGTGGRSEYVKIWNDTWSTSATWDGYKGDWYNITFPEPFTLKSGETYDYTIETGSYPQIIHKKEFNATGGKITCTEFVDVNGKRYDDWIPAIKLE